MVTRPTPPPLTTDNRIKALESEMWKIKVGIGLVVAIATAAGLMNLINWSSVSSITDSLAALKRDVAQQVDLVKSNKGEIRHTASLAVTE
jgi:hypothetical protein